MYVNKLRGFVPNVPPGTLYSLVHAYTCTYMPCGHKSLFLHLNEYSRLIRHFTVQNCSAADLTNTVVEESLFSLSEASISSPINCLHVNILEKKAGFSEAIAIDFYFFSLLFSLRSQALRLSEKWHGPIWLKQVQHQDKFQSDLTWALYKKFQAISTDSSC